LCHQDGISSWGDIPMALATRHAGFEALITADHWHILREI